MFRPASAQPPSGTAGGPSQEAQQRTVVALEVLGER
jgi:hypothetical protein